MTREKLIKKYEDMAYKYGRHDSWDDEIEPELHRMSTAEIKENYEADKKYFESKAGV